MNINTISCKCNMSYKHYINQPISALERRMKMIIAKNPQLINSLNCNKNHPLIRKYSHLPFNNIYMYITNITDDYDNMTSTNCTAIEDNIDIIIPALLFTIPCGLSFLCLMSLMVYTLVKPLINKK